LNLQKALLALITVCAVGTAWPADEANELTIQILQRGMLSLRSIGRQDSMGFAYTEEDVEALARIVYWEARGECQEGQMAVANVVLNRVRDGRWPDTIQKVIAQRGQFTPYRNKRYFKVQIPLQFHDIARRALMGEQAVPEDYFYFSTGKPRRYAKDFIRIGSHYFGRAK